MIYEAKQHVWLNEDKENLVYCAQIWVKATTEEEAIFTAKKLAKELNTSKDIKDSMDFIALTERMS